MVQTLGLASTCTLWQKKVLPGINHGPKTIIITTMRNFCAFSFRDPKNNEEFIVEYIEYIVTCLKGVENIYVLQEHKNMSLCSIQLCHSLRKTTTTTMWLLSVFLRHQQNKTKVWFYWFVEVDDMKEVWTWINQDAHIHTLQKKS